MPDLDFAMMVASYQRRQDWLAERQAVHTINLLGQALGGKKRNGTRSGGPPKQVTTNQMFAAAGGRV